MAANRLGTKRSQRNIKWIEEYCRVPEGKFVGQAVKLRPWQKNEIRKIYDSITRTIILSFARKNGKTALSAMLLLLHLVGPEARANSQLLSAAQSRDQAALLFALAAKMVRLSQDLSDHVMIRDTVKELYCPELGTIYKALSADAKTKFGMSPVFVVHDELGQVKGPLSDLYEAIETGCGAHENPLSVIISTQAPSDGDLLSILIDDAASGEDPTIKVSLYTADESLDPFSEKAIKQANPAYGDFLSKEETQRTAEKARRMPSRESSYRNLNLNQRVSLVSPFIPRALWEACSGPIDHDAFFESPVYVGLDLSSRNDLTAMVYIAQSLDGVWNVKAEFFAPVMNLKERVHNDRAPYDVWSKQDYLTLTPGASVKYEYVAMRLCQLCDDYDVAAIGFDRWRIDVLETELARTGVELPLVPFGQGFKDMAPALDEVESQISNENVRHGNNPLLTWCAANSIVLKDPAGNRKLDKAKSTGRIDGMVAKTIAFGVAITKEEEETNPYESHGLRTL